MKLTRFKSTKMVAACLMKDDWFRMGGMLYRITDVRMNDYGHPVINFRPATNLRASWVHTLILDRNTKLKVYNQK